MDTTRETLLQDIWKSQDDAYDLMVEYDSLPHSYGENTLYQAEAHLIDLIGRHPDITISDLAVILGRTPSSCSQLVHKLRSKNWVEQVKNSANNRQYMLRLTPDGQQVYQDHAAFDRQCQERTFRRLDQFTDQELALFLQVQHCLNEAYADDLRQSHAYFNGKKNVSPPKTK